MDVTLSKKARSARRAIQSTFITPPTSNSSINAQQQPTQLSAMAQTEHDATRCVAAIAAVTHDELKWLLTLSQA